MLKTLKLSNKNTENEEKQNLVGLTLGKRCRGKTESSAMTEEDVNKLLKIR
jgi:hypothetical protein